MKRKTKNIIIITLIIILGIASGFTVKLAKDSVSTNSENVGQKHGNSTRSRWSRRARTKR